MNVASWIILAIVVVWIGVAVKSAFFGESKKRSSRCSSDGGTRRDRLGRKSIRPETRALPESDGSYRLPSVCAGCSKGSCSGCPGVNRGVPMPIIHELK